MRVMKVNLKNNGRFLCAMDAIGRTLLTDRDLFLEIRCRYNLNANIEYSMQTATNASLAGPFTCSPKKISTPNFDEQYTKNLQQISSSLSQNGFKPKLKVQPLSWQSSETGLRTWTVTVS